MADSNVHTSVVIELSSQEESEDQKTYRIDIDDMDLPKDYIIDQIYCGENVTVYALFEVPEGSKISDKNLIDMPNSHLQENYKFFHKSSYREIINEKKINKFKHNSAVISSEEDVKFLSDRNRGNESFYCLKHLAGDYGMLSPEKKNSELKGFYSKEDISKSTKFKTPKELKVKSKGMNTDIVQSPKIMEEVQRAVEVNIPFARKNEKSVEDFCSSFGKSSYEVIEMEMQQSYSSVNSDSDKKSIPNFFIVPLLMVEDGILNHYEKSDKSQRLEDEKPLCSKRIITPKVSLGTNTDISFDSYKKMQNSNEGFQSESYKTDSDNYDDQNLYDKNENSDEKLKINNKEAIIKEIKIMQRKLNFLIKSIESNDFVYNAKENESSGKMVKNRTENLERMAEPWLNETCQKKHQTSEECPIFLPFRFPSYPNKVKAKTKKKIQNTSKSRNSATSTTFKKSVSKEFLPNEESSQTLLVRSHQTTVDKVKKLASNTLINYFDLENRKTCRLSKSEHCFQLNIHFLKHTLNGLKKSQSFDLKGDKMEAFKKTKNFLYKVEGCIKTKTNMRIHQNKEGSLRDNLSPMKNEMGDDVDKKALNTYNEVLNVTQLTEKTEKSEKLEKSEKTENLRLEEIVTDTKKNFCEEGDAKLIYPKETRVTANVEKVQVHYHYADVIAPIQKKSTFPSPVLSKTAEVPTKINSDAEKPITPNKSSKKIKTAESNAMKDLKIYKKVNNKVKVGVKANKSETKEFSLSGTENKKASLGYRNSFRRNADSKLHINKLVKLDSLGNNLRTPFSAKTNQDEKTGAKSERVSRPVSQRQERPVDMILEENVKEKNEISAKKSVTLVPVESFAKNNVQEKEEPICSGNEGKIPEEVNLNLTSENLVPLYKNPSLVVVELFSKKSESMSKLYEENVEKHFNGENAIFEKNGDEKESNQNSENLEKSIVKSVWALTKVLLYDDGTNKLEILEASLTPPEYSLN